MADSGALPSGEPSIEPSVDAKAATTPTATSSTPDGDREARLQEQLATPIPATAVPLYVTAGWFRLAPDESYVPLSVAIPGGAVRGTTTGELDVLGAVRDEQGRPVGRIRQTLKLAPEGGTKQVLYQSGLALPPGRFSAKVVVRENGTGAVGSFETSVFVPDLRRLQ